MTKPRELFPSSSSPSPSKLLGIGHQSQVITKLKPKIRVIHVDAPKIIQTDAANFRDLVQRLTGNKPEDKNGRTMEKQEEQDFLGLRNGKKKRIKNEEDEEDHDDDDEILMRRSKSNKESFSGFFDHHHQHGFSEFDGFMEQDLVQRLTGNKPEDKNRRTMENQEEQDFLGLRNGKKKRIKNEEDEEDHDEILMRRSKSNKESFSGFFDHHHQHGFSEFDGFMEQLSTIN